MASGRARHRSPPPCSRCGCRGSGSLAGTLARCSDRRTAGLSTHTQSMGSEAPRARGSSKRLAHCRPSPIVSCRFACTIGRRLPGPLCPGAPPSRTLGTCSCISAGCGPARAPSAHPQSAVPPWQRQASQAVPSQRGSGDPARRPRTAGSCHGRPATRGGPSCPQRRSDNPQISMAQPPALRNNAADAAQDSKRDGVAAAYRVSSAAPRPSRHWT